LPDGLALEIDREGSAAVMCKAGGSARILKAELADLLFIPGAPRTPGLRETDPERMHPAA
jgi:hypothetical protein